MIKFDLPVSTIEMNINRIRQIVLKVLNHSFKSLIFNQDYDDYSKIKFIMEPLRIENICMKIINYFKCITEIQKNQTLKQRFEKSIKKLKSGVGVE